MHRFCSSTRCDLRRALLAATMTAMLAVTLLASGCGLQDGPAEASSPPIDTSTPPQPPGSSAQLTEDRPPPAVSFPEATLPGRDQIDPAAAAGRRYALPSLAPEDKRPSPFDGLVVHQTGLVSAIVTSDGQQLSGLHHRFDGLPPFVHRLGYQGVDAEALKAGNAYLPEPAVTRLETAATWVYSQKPRTLEMTVDIPDGYPAGWFPAVDTRRPRSLTTCPCDDTQLTSAGLDALADGRFHQTLSVTNRAPDRVDVPDSTLWDALRDVPAASFVQTSGKRTDEADRFSSFSAVGTARLPFEITYEEKDYLDEFTFKNRSAATVPRMFLLDVHPNRGRLMRLPSVPAGGFRTFSPAPKEAPVPIGRLADRTFHVLSDLLADQGLTRREAEATANAWLQTDLLEPGTRLLYVLPRPWTNRLYPMALTPTPKSIVRTFVGRLEVLEPEDEQRAVQQVYRAHKNNTSLVELAGDNRFATPTFRRACQLIDFKPVADWCRNQVATLRRRVIDEAPPPQASPKK